MSRNVNHDQAELLNPGLYAYHLGLIYVIDSKLSINKPLGGVMTSTREYRYYDVKDRGIYSMSNGTVRALSAGFAPFVPVENKKLEKAVKESIQESLRTAAAEFSRKWESVDTIIR